MKILAIGDLVGDIGLNKLKETLPNLIEAEDIDFVIANVENVASGMGITQKDFQILDHMKIDVMTMGNHTWGKKDIFSFIDNPKLLRPANYSKGIPGHGYNIYECKGKNIAVISLIGRTAMNVLSENPFIVVDEILGEIKNKTDMVFVDFHAEATAEKIAMGRFLDGKITALFGTHTHVQTADEQILPEGTAYITDLGMTGPRDSVIGMDAKVSFKRFETALPEKYKLAEGECMLNAVEFEVDDNTNKVISIKRIQIQ